MSPEYPVERTRKVPLLVPLDCSIMLPTGSLVLQTLSPGGRDQLERVGGAGVAGDVGRRLVVEPMLLTAFGVGTFVHFAQ